jgi:lysophospholipase L1-like esterase
MNNNQLYFILKICILLILTNIILFVNSTSDKYLTIACVGDSITQGFHFGGKSYPFILEGLIKNTYLNNKVNINVTNYGISGTTIQKGTSTKKGKSSYWDFNELSLALDSKPTIILILFGTNDSKQNNWKNIDNFKNDYYDMINKFNNLSSKPKIYIMTPPPYYATKSLWLIQGDVINRELPNIIIDIGREKNIEIIDIFNSLGGDHLTIPTAFFNNHHRNKFIGDGCHPNHEGYTIMANTIFDKIKQDIFKQY